MNDSKYKNIDLGILSLFDDIHLSNQKVNHNYFEISGYPHYENVASNILSFYFDSNEEHNLKELVIKSLIECYEEKAEIKIVDEISSYELQNGDIEVREHNANGKRIDILLMLDNRLIIIENKIFAGDEKNPYNEYHKEALRIARDFQIKDKYIYEILLSKDIIATKIGKNDDYRFYNITYEEFFKKIKRNIGEYLLKANEKWLIFLKEFIENIENLSKEYCIMFDDNFINLQKLLDSNSRSIQNAIRLIYEDIENKKQLFREITKKIVNTKKFDDVSNYGMSRSQSLLSYFSIYVNIRNKNNNIIAIEPYIWNEDTSKIQLVLWNRNNKQYDWNEEKELFKEQYKPNTEENGGWGNTLHLKTYSFSNEEDLKDIERFDEIITEVGDRLIKYYSNN